MTPPRRRFHSFTRFTPLLVFSLGACSSDGSIGLTDVLAASGGGSANASACNGVLGDITVETVNVPRGASCTLNGTRVRGDVKVYTGANLTAVGARVIGNVQAEDANSVTIQDGTVVGGNVQVKRRSLVRVEDSFIDGDLQLEESGASLVATDNRIGGNLQVKKAESAAIARTRIDGDLQLEENRGELASFSAFVLGNLQVFKNSGGVSLEQNQIAQSLQCKENTPAPVGGDNVAGEKEDQCSVL